LLKRGNSIKPKSTSLFDRRKRFKKLQEKQMREGDANLKFGKGMSYLICIPFEPKKKKIKTKYFVVLLPSFFP
jgi:hypothetical protein